MIKWKNFLFTCVFSGDKDKASSTVLVSLPEANVCELEILCWFQINEAVFKVEIYKWMTNLNSPLYKHFEGLEKYMIVSSEVKD